MKAGAIVIACFAAADEVLLSGGNNDAIRARLEDCLPAAAAMSCYEETLWATAFFASKRSGVSLERALRGYPAPFEGLIEEVYRSDKDEFTFRRDRFAGCVGRQP